MATQLNQNTLDLQEILDAVNALPEAGGGGITPTGELAITENGTYDVTEYASASVNVSGGGGSVEPPAVGFVPTEWNADGSYKDGTWYGTTIPSRAFGASSATHKNPLTSKITNITLPSNLLEIGQYAFHSCTNLALTSLPDSLTSIYASAFHSCTNLALTSLPDSLTSIYGSAFHSCTNLALTSLPDSLTSIGDYAFSGCTKLALTSLPDGLTSIGKQVFSECDGTAEIILHAGIASIGEGAFSDCSLESVTFEGTPTQIDSSAFARCYSLLTINVPWAEGAVAGAPWGATNATINYNYTGE